MLRTAPRDVPPASTTYKGFQLVQVGDGWYGDPGRPSEDELRDSAVLTRRPDVLCAPTREALEGLVDEAGAPVPLPELAGQFEGYSLVRFGGHVYGVPGAPDFQDLDPEEVLEGKGVVRGATCDEVRGRIRADGAATAVEFAGWLPVFKRFGDCGTHPQFGHTHSPPPGYKFVASAAEDSRRARRTPWGWLNPLPCAAALCRGLGAALRPGLAVVRNALRFGPVRSLRALAGAARLFVRLRRGGGRLIPALRFIHSRHLQSQVMLPPNPGLVFLTSVPYTYGQHPWVIEVEDSTSLFFPFVPNGRTAALDVARSPYFPMVKALLEADSCKGIITHIRSTAETLPTLFRSEAIARKTSYVPLGVALPPAPVDQDDDEHLDLLFTNSWHQNPQGFFLRGGLDVLEAFAVLHRQYPHLRLTIRASLPPLSRRYARLVSENWVRVFGHFLSREEMDALQRRAHVYLLPAARIHIVSLLQAMAYGQAVVASDGWGIPEYVTHEENGLIVKGRAGKVSWMDAEAGLLREDYRPMFHPDWQVVEGIVEAVSRLVEDRALRKRVAAAARADVAAKYNPRQWNLGLKAAFDRALAA